MVDGREANIVVLLDLFGGNIFSALQKARRHRGLSVTMSTATLERLLIELLMNAGWDDRRIVAALSGDDGAVNPDRVRRIRKESIERRIDGGR